MANFDEIGRGPNGERMYIDPNKGTVYSFPGNAGTPDAFMEAMGLDERQREFMKMYQQAILEDDIPAYIRQGKSRPRTVQALMMFGPSHGKTMEATHPAPEVLVTVADVSPVGFVDYSKMTPGEMARSTRIGQHRYRRMDTFSSAQGEDVVLYTHDENCCDETLKPPEEAKPPRYRPKIV